VTDSQDNTGSQDSDQPIPRQVFLTEGLIAGLLLALTDWVAGGVARTPVLVALFGLAVFAVGGLLAGLVATLFRRHGIATALATGGALAVHGLSIVSKNLGGPQLDTERHLVATACCIAALHFGALAGWTYACTKKRPDLSPSLAWLGVLVVAAGVPASSLFGKLEPGASIQLTVIAAISFPILAWLLKTRARLTAISALVLLVGLALPVALYDHEPPRRFLPSSSDAGPAAEAPNVVLFVIDTVRADQLHSETEHTPNLSRLAEGGAQFTQAISSASWTLPATSSLLTSLYPSQHGAVMATTTLPGDVVTLAEVFHGAGYETAAFTGGAFVSPAFGLDQGFEYFDHLAEFNFRPFRFHTPLAWRLAKNRYLPLRALLARVNEFGGMRAVRSRVNEWLEARSTERPFFLLVHTYQVHDYYIYHPDPDDQVLDSLGPISDRFAGRLSVHPSELLTATQSDLDWFRALYDNRLQHVDGQLGELMGELESHLGGAPLVTAMTSDHGEGFDAKTRRIHHGDRLHDDLLRVPFLLQAPGQIEPGTRIDSQVRSIDLMPTLIDLAGLTIPDGLSGQSLLPSLLGKTEWPAEAFGEEIRDDRRKLALRTNEWKLIRGSGAAQNREIYNLGLDPAESTQAEETPPTLLLDSLSGFRERYSERPRQESTIDEATESHLRALGYIE